MNLVMFAVNIIIVLTVMTAEQHVYVDIIRIVFVEKNATKMVCFGINFMYTIIDYQIIFDNQLIDKSGNFLFTM